LLGNLFYPTLSTFENLNTNTYQQLSNALLHPPEGRSRSSSPRLHQMESPNPEDPVETAVFRAGWLLKKLFLASRQRASCEATHKWEWDPEHTCLYIGRLVRPGEFLMFTSDVGITSSFPITAENQEMILSAHYSKEAVGFFSDLLKLLLQGKLPFQKYILAKA
jgi:hypothetical protein